MESVSWKQDRVRLEQELWADDYQVLLQRLQTNMFFLQQFRTWADVIAFMRGGTSTDPRKDEILRPIFAAHADDQDPRWRAVLLAIFWPGLESIHFQKRGWDADSSERWQNIMWTFLQVVCRVDEKRRPDRLVQKIFNDTVSRLSKTYRRSWNRMNREIATDPKDLAAHIDEIGGASFAGTGLHETQEFVIQRLRQHMEAGRLSEADFLLLVGTRVYETSIANYARAGGLDYQVAKKRRQRAEAALNRFERKQAKIFEENVSPSGAFTPPFTVRGQYHAGRRREENQ